MRTVTCRCEELIEAAFPEEIDLDNEINTGLLIEILEGNFFAVDCPKCGERIKPEFAVRLRSKKRSLDLLVLPEIERLAFYLDKIRAPKGGEILIGYAELYERALIISEGLDAEAIEIIKYWLASRASEEAPKGSEIAITYAGKNEEDRLKFQIHGLRKNEIAIIPVRMDYYEKTRSDLSRTRRKEPFDKILAGPYKSIRALEADD